MDGTQCPICCKPILENDKKSKLTAKGCESIEKGCETRGVPASVKPGEQVHINCRKEFCRESSIQYHNKKREDKPALGRKQALRSIDKPFDYKRNCLFCGSGAIYDGKKKDFKLTPVRTYDFQTEIREDCKERKDDWGLKVKSRVDFVVDLPAADATYHPPGMQC